MRAAVLFLLLGAACGCDRRAPSGGSGKDASDRGDRSALEDLEKKIRPPGPAGKGVGPGGELPSTDPSPPLLADSLVKAVDAEDVDGARARFISEKDLRSIAPEGIATILASSLLPENQRVVERLLEESKGKEVSLGSFKPGDLKETEPGAPYRVKLTQMNGATLEVIVGGSPRSFRLDLLSVGGWKIFKIAPAGAEGGG